MAGVNPSKKCLGIFTRRERWGLSWRGWTILMLAVFAAGATWTLTAHPFLAETKRVNTNILVVEGWVHEYAIRAAAEEFTNGAYEKIFTTGGPVEGSGWFTNDFDTSASVGAELLKQAGIPAQSVVAVPAHEVGRDRTYASAVALRQWFGKHKMIVRSFNVLTEDAHARRTRLLFQEAFGRSAAIGIISIPNPDYDARRWWHYSAGVREVFGESIAWIYAAIFFHPAGA